MIAAVVLGLAGELVPGSAAMHGQVAASQVANQAAQGPANASADQGDAKARKLLDQMVQALGGQKWLTLKDIYLEGRTSGFFQGKPTGAITNFTSLHTLPTPQGQGEERIEFGKKRDDITIFTPTEAWEATYRGKQPVPDDQAQEYFRRRNHSIETAILVWLKDPSTVLLSEGQTVAERHLTDQVTLISSSNEAITLQLDAETHLPLRRVYKWRDPLYKDQNEDIEAYDDYHTIDGIATPFTITRFHNGDMNSERFLYRAAYNVPIPPGAFDPNAAAARVIR
jgi:hypothetical protein